MEINLSDDELPSGAWATPGRSAEGVYGIVLGHGRVTLRFIPETMIADFTDTTGLQLAGDEDYLGMVRAAAESLPAFKREYADRLAKGAAAKNN